LGLVLKWIGPFVIPAPHWFGSARHYLVAGFFHAQKWAIRMEKKMSVTHIERVSMSTPHQFAASLPTLVGFTPNESVVIAMLRDSQLIATMRCDIPDNWTTAIENITSTVLRLGADRALIAVATNHRVGKRPFKAEIADLITDLSIRDIPVSEAILVDQRSSVANVYARVRNGVQ